VAGSGLLLSTGTLEPLPDHIEEPDPPAEWLYFRIWMEVRAEVLGGHIEPAAH